MNMDVVDQVRKAAEKGEDLGWLFDLSLPVLGGIVGTQIVHEMGHAIIALKDGIKIGPPTLIPSTLLGLSGAITPIKLPPKNLKSLFDFAIAGPLFDITT
ncbi:hypothetical protein ACHAWO_003440 [Cyclotella atomus]|uniref:Peptidase M50 domain-containing protein n=1 Tax=Cyclotella atomus TaxID=382360 RepID=A0ABD3PYK9_9STRA